MRNLIIIIIFFFVETIFSQNINLNESHVESYIRDLQLLDEIEINNSFTIRPIALKNINTKSPSFFSSKNYAPTILNFFENRGKIKILPIDINLEFNSHHPYNRNNGSMVPNRGFQNLISLGFYAELGPLSIQLKPEYVYSENLNFPQFWEGHYDVIWAKRYVGWNRSDIPERFGEESISHTLLGQSFIKLNYKKLSLGISNENLWWGPSIRNSIMMSNHARGFNHISFNTNKPINTFVGSFEWQFVTGRLELSGFPPTQSDKTYNGRNLWVPEHNQARFGPDWRYFQGLIFTYNPKWTKGLSIGYIKWAQLYGGFLEGEYDWMDQLPGYFPLFSNLFKQSADLADTNGQIDEAAGLFFKWLWKKTSTELYGEFYFNDAKVNLRDLLLDSDHARAATIGFRKGFDINKSKYIFSWEWTQLEQTGGRLLRNAGSWYTHFMVNAGYTNRGEVLGAGIGPGSNSHYLSLVKHNEKYRVGVFSEIIDHDNDFYYYAFESAKDFRRYWKDFNFGLNFEKKVGNYWGRINFLYSRSLNYQWELDDTATPYYHPGKDVDNFHVNLKFIYEIPVF
jgi:hypothetical protein